MEKELYHAGIKGMKWGRRRYQNPDGTLTPEGKKRYSDDYIKAHSKKSVEEMSDAELRNRNNRLQMEKQYEQLTKTTSKGKKAVDAFIATGTTLGALLVAGAAYKKFGKAVAGTKAGGAMVGAGKKVAGKAIDKIGDHVLKGIKIGRLD